MVIIGHRWWTRPELVPRAVRLVRCDAPSRGGRALTVPEFAVVPGLYAAGTAAATTEVRGGYVAGWSNTRAIALAHRAVAHVSEGTS